MRHILRLFYFHIFPGETSSTCHHFLPHTQQHDSPENSVGRTPGLRGKYTPVCPCPIGSPTMMLFRPCPCIEERREKKRGNGFNALKTRYPNPQICRPTTVCPPRQLAVPYPNGLFIAERRAAKKRGPSQASTPLQKRRATRPQEPRRTGQLVRQYFKTPSSPHFFSHPSHPTVKTNATAAQLEGEKRPFFPRRLWLEEEETHTRTYTQLQR